MINKLSHSSFIRESKSTDIRFLQPDTVLSVFHGTKPLTALDICRNGLDSTNTEYLKKYKPYFGHEYEEPIAGLFVSPDLQTSSKFGPILLKFKVLGKDLYDAYPATLRWAKATQDPRYKESFRKEVTASLTAGNFNNNIPVHNPRIASLGYENEALFKGILRPESIEAVYWLEKSTSPAWKPVKFAKMSKEEFIKRMEFKPPLIPNFTNIHPESSRK